MVPFYDISPSIRMKFPKETPLLVKRISVIFAEENVRLISGQRDQEIGHGHDDDFP